MKVFLLLLVTGFTAAGCIPLRQEALIRGPSHPALMLCDERYLLSDVDLNRETIDVKESYIKSPAGRRYRLRIQPHQFDIDQKRSYRSAELHPYAENGSPLEGWRSGVWSFHLVVQTNGSTQVIDQKRKYWFFYYNPIIHGPPN